MVYFIDSASRKLGFSRRHIVRLAERIGKKPSVMGSQIVYLFGDADLAAMKRASKEPRKSSKEGRPRMYIAKVN